MNRDTFIRVTLIFLLYVVLTQLMLSGYETKMEQMFKVNEDILRTCSKTSAGDDLNENYLR